jgi:hypothetical protein
VSSWLGSRESTKCSLQYGDCNGTLELIVCHGGFPFVTVKVLLVEKSDSNRTRVMIL